MLFSGRMFHYVQHQLVPNFGHLLFGAWQVVHCWFIRAFSTKNRFLLLMGMTLMRAVRLNHNNELRDAELRGVVIILFGFSFHIL